MAVFDISIPDRGPARSMEARDNAIAFGDGYEQRSGDGINGVREEWDLNFTLRTKTEVEAIVAFLAARKGVESFDWTTPVGQLKRFTCKKWTPIYNHDGDASLSCTFRQVFEPTGS